MEAIVRKSLKIGLLAGIGIAALSCPAFADIVFTLGNNPEPGEENISFGGTETGTTIQGTTNQSNQTVFFSSLTGQDLLQQAQGQADILQNVTKPQQNSQLTSMDINLTGANTTNGTGLANPTLGFTDFIMNPLNGSGTATVQAFDNFGQTFTYDLGNGQNFLTLTTINGEFITDVQITVAGGSFIEFKQPRISGVCTISGGGCTPVPVPLPGAVTLFGSVLGGAFWLLRRRNRATPVSALA
jgi:hypothetical protein